MSDKTLEATFREEAEQICLRLESGLGELADGRQDREILDEIFRAAHNLKGAAMGMERRDAGETAHVLEELFSRWRDGRLATRPALVSWAVGAVDVLRELCDDKQDAGAAAVTGAIAAEHETQLRVPLRAIDGALDTIGEWIIAAGRSASLIDALPADSRRNLAEAQAVTESFCLSLRETLMEIRLVSTAPLVQRLRRTVADTARKLGKQVEMVVVGEDETLDTTLIEGLRDPLMHMVRNAVDHGVEMPDVRMAGGKSATGKLILSFQKLGGTALVRLQDDGRGIDRQKVAKKLRTEGRLRDDQTLSDTDVANFIFQPGFSTAEQVTDISGRGVGLDVVKRNIEQLRGSVAVTSPPGQGTTFTISVPLSLAILHGMHVEVASQSFIVPQERVVECVEGTSGDDRAFSTMRVRETTVPCIRLGSFIGHSSPKGRQAVLLLSHASGQIGLVVDRSLGEKQTVLKPVGPLFRTLPMVSGATVLGNGDVALVLDVDKLFEISTARWHAASLNA